ncbi:MAG: DUF2484 family protein [Tabrizicola sp.]|uniref:DUF2484 family protein n=1 Tax=Tabrizicola sp. TaxID=2005166 RepID=UPI0027362B46|nr:DUF2484 family protein [Tabrizicola sp.]MDP3263851.1 DUF2484 family protein [Tabrizicola sp.]MDP3647215.1 DUF2484 family protein [Paracoccaceae bacterium]MDZ4088448.1 DUF2484 family protein [Tabrizicola sp.]
MMLPLALCLVWLVLANLIAMFPSRDHHWRAAYVLIALGIPLLGWVTYEHGPIIGIAVLAAGASILRWPLVFFWRWVRSKVGSREG